MPLNYIVHIILGTVLIMMGMIDYKYPLKEGDTLSPKLLAHLKKDEQIKTIKTIGIASVIIGIFLLLMGITNLM